MCGYLFYSFLLPLLCRLGILWSGVFGVQHALPSAVTPACPCLALTFFNLCLPCPSSLLHYVWEVEREEWRDGRDGRDWLGVDGSGVWLVMPAMPAIYGILILPAPFSPYMPYTHALIGILPVMIIPYTYAMSHVMFGIVLPVCLNTIGGSLGEEMGPCVVPWVPFLLGNQENFNMRAQLPTTGPSAPLPAMPLLLPPVPMGGAGRTCAAATYTLCYYLPTWEDFGRMAGEVGYFPRGTLFYSYACSVCGLGEETLFRCIPTFLPPLPCGRLDETVGGTPPCPCAHS